MDKNIKLFVLAGCWECPDDIGVTVVAISNNKDCLVDKLNQIATTQANEYVNIDGYIVLEEHTDTKYEISGDNRGNARFYITEEPAMLDEMFMGEISREIDEDYRREDAKNYLQGLYESGELDEDVYEILITNELFLLRAVELFSKMEDCNIPFNTTMRMAINEARREMHEKRVNLS